MHRAPCAPHRVTRSLQRASCRLQDVLRAPQIVLWRMATAEWHTRRVLCCAFRVRRVLHSAARFAHHVFRTTSFAPRRMPCAGWQLQDAICMTPVASRLPRRGGCDVLVGLRVLTNGLCPLRSASRHLLDAPRPTDYRHKRIFATFHYYCERGRASCRTTISW